MKALPKKHVYEFWRSLSLKIPNASRIISRQVLWYSASLLMYGWFSGWVAYEIFAWNKPITQVSPTNLMGAITAIALIWAGTRIFDAPRHVVAKQLKKLKTLKKIGRRKRNRQISNPPLTPPKQPAQSQPEPTLQIEQPKPTPSTRQTAPRLPGCNRQVQRGENQEIPDECLICKQLIQCLATKN